MKVYIGYDERERTAPLRCAADEDPAGRDPGRS